MGSRSSAILPCLKPKPPPDPSSRHQNSAIAREGDARRTTAPHLSATEQPRGIPPLPQGQWPPCQRYNVPTKVQTAPRSAAVLPQALYLISSYAREKGPRAPPDGHTLWRASAHTPARFGGPALEHYVPEEGSADSQPVAVRFSVVL